MTELNPGWSYILTTIGVFGLWLAGGKDWRGWGRKADQVVFVLGLPAWLVQGVLGLKVAPELADSLPFGTFTTAELEDVAGQDFECTRVAALGQDFQQFAMNGDPCRIHLQGFFEDLLGLQVASISQIDICFRDGVDIAGRIKLAGRIRQGRASGRLIGGVDSLPATGAEEGIGLELAFEE